MIEAIQNHFVMGDNDDRSALIATPNRRAFSNKNYLLRSNPKKKPRHIGIELMAGAPSAA